MDSCQFLTGDVKSSNSTLLERREENKGPYVLMEVQKKMKHRLTNLTLYRCIWVCMLVCAVHPKYLLTGSDSPIKAYRDVQALKD